LGNPEAVDGEKPPEKHMEFSCVKGAPIAGCQWKTHRKIWIFMEDPVKQ